MRRQNSRPFSSLPFFSSLFRKSKFSRMSNYDDRRPLEERGYPEESDHAQPGGLSMKHAGRSRASSSPRVDWSVARDGQRECSDALSYSHLTRALIADSEIAH